MKAYLESHGCTMNYGEGRIARSSMERAGYTFVPSPEEADVLLLNTCGVIGVTENAMYRRIRELDMLGKRLLVTGCLSTARAREISEASPGAMVFPPGRIDVLDTLLNLNLEPGAECWNAAESNDLIVPISQGCLSVCSYCFSRLARGNVRSVGPETILGMVKSHLSGEGEREILLSSMDTITYGRDIGTTLPSLIRSITSLEGRFMLRVGMMNPSLLPPLLDELLDSYADSRVYKFFHIPFQSGSDRILKAMKRGYTAGQFREIVRRIREVYPDATLSTDLIVGFPGETDDDFTESLRLMEEVRPDIVNVTRFSAREGTPAFSMKGQVPGWKMKERSRAATASRFAISAGKHAGMHGREVSVLVTEKGKNGYSIGRLANYRQAIVRGDYDAGVRLNCLVTGSTPIHLVCDTLVQERLSS